jgi:hypothetical protein
MASAFEGKDEFLATAFLDLAAEFLGDAIGGAVHGHDTVTAFDTGRFRGAAGHDGGHRGSAGLERDGEGFSAAGDCRFQRLVRVLSGVLGDAERAEEADAVDVGDEVVGAKAGLFRGATGFDGGDHRGLGGIIWSWRVALRCQNRVRESLGWRWSSFVVPSRTYRIWRVSCSLRTMRQVTLSALMPPQRVTGLVIDGQAVTGLESGLLGGRFGQDIADGGGGFGFADRTAEPPDGHGEDDRQAEG